MDLTLSILIAFFFLPIGYGNPYRFNEKPNHEDEYSWAIRQPKAFHDPSPNVLTPHYLRLRKGTSQSMSSKILGSLQRSPDFTNLTATYHGEEIIVDIAFGDSNFTAILDTGSSDTWLVRKGFRCANSGNFRQYIPPSRCRFGPALEGGFQEGQIHAQNFEIRYYDRETVRGEMGYVDVTIAGIKVAQQEVALVDEAYWYGNGISSGLIGLAYQSLDHAYNGGDYTYDAEYNQLEYSVLFQSMYSRGLVKPIFSLAAQRGEQAGYIAFGGLPPVNVSSEFATTPIQLFAYYQIRKHKGEYQFYTIFPDAFVYGNSQQRIDLPPESAYIVDSGTTLIYLPPDIAQAINAAFDPPARYIRSYQGYYVKCDAKPPPFGVVIGGKLIRMDPRDMIYTNSTDHFTGDCLTAIAGGGRHNLVLGMAFLKSVVAVFDVGASEMRFAEHHYDAGSNVIQPKEPSASHKESSHGNSATKMTANDVVPCAYILLLCFLTYMY